MQNSKLTTRYLAMACLVAGNWSTGASARGAGVDRVTPEPGDLSVWRPQTGYFYGRTLAGATTATRWGASTDIPVEGDFDGDGKLDIAVWRPSTGYWYIIQSSNGQVVTHQWGASTDIPVVGDFDGDGKADIAVWRPSTGYWYIIQSGNGQRVTRQFGAASDVPVIGDFDGDGKTDCAVWRPSTGTWYVLQSSTGVVSAKTWGASTDMPVAGDFDGDGKTDLAVWRPSTGYWYIIQSSNREVVAKQWGAAGDIPVPRDYDGDGKTDFAVWRPSTGYWYVVDSDDGSTFAAQWGASTDIPANGSVEPEAASGTPVGGTTSGFWLPYTATALIDDGKTGVFVLPSDNLSAPPVFVTTAKAALLASASSATLSGKRIIGSALARLMYTATAADGNIHIYGLDLTSSTVPVPVQIGTLSLPDGQGQLCGVAAAQGNVYQPDTLWVLLHVNPTSTSARNNCNVSGDVYEVINYTDSPTTAPVAVALTSTDFTPLYLESGALAGIVTQQGSSLDFYAGKAFTSPTLLAANVVSSLELIHTNSTGQDSIGDDVSFYAVSTAANTQVYRITTAAVATSVYTTASNLVSLAGDHTGDSASVFFNDVTSSGFKMLRAPINVGSAVTLYTEDLTAGTYQTVGSNGSQYAYIENSKAGNASVKVISATAPSAPTTIATFTAASIDSTLLAEGTPGTLSSSQILLNFVDVPAATRSSAASTFGGTLTQGLLANSTFLAASQGVSGIVYQLRGLSGITDDGGGGINVYTISSATAVPLTLPGGGAYAIPGGTFASIIPVASSAAEAIGEGIGFSSNASAAATDAASHLIVPLSYTDTQIMAY